jgi:predicted phosphate transport protein (TIGR00153 family)
VSLACPAPRNVRDVRFRLIPRDEGFFALFNQAAENAAATASLAHEMFTRLPDVETMAEKALEFEERGDQLTRTIRRALDTAVVTPFDREDIHALAESIDTAVDHMTGAVDLVRLHHITEPLDGIAELGDLVAKASEAVVRAVSKLSRLRDLQEDLDEVDRLESQGDQLYRRTTALLFSGSYKAFTVLKWKDIVESLERALNAFEHTADVITSIALKHG